MGERLFSKAKLDFHGQSESIYFVTIGSLSMIVISPYTRERSGSVVECLTPDRGAVGSSLTGFHCGVVLEQDTFILA